MARPAHKVRLATPNLFTSGQVYTFPSTGTLTILDANVTPTSLIVLLYVAGGVTPALSQNPVLISTAPGSSPLPVS